MGSVETLAKYRFQRVWRELAAVKEMLSGGMYEPSLNRSYYSIFHAMRAITVLEGFGAANMAGVIAYFNQNFIKTGIFAKETSKIIKISSIMKRQSGLFELLYLRGSKTQRASRLRGPKQFIEAVEKYLKDKGSLKLIICNRKKAVSRSNCFFRGEKAADIRGLF